MRDSRTCSAICCGTVYTRLMIAGPPGRFEEATGSCAGVFTFLQPSPGSRSLLRPNSEQEARGALRYFQWTR